MSRAEGRDFGLKVGAAFLVLAAIAAWRGRHATMYVLGTLGTLLIIGGAVVPAQMGPVFRAWMGLAHAISKVTTPIAMGVVYFLVFTPVALIMRLGRRDALGLRRPKGTSHVGAAAGRRTTQ